MSNPIRDAKYVWYGDLEKIIQAQYNRPDYNLLDGDGGEHNQDSIITFDVPGGSWDKDALTIEQWQAGESGEWGMTQPDLATLCHELFVRGLLPEGFYVVHVWW